MLTVKTFFVKDKKLEEVLLSIFAHLANLWTDQTYQLRKKLSLHNGKANFARAQHALDLEFFTVEYSKVSNKRTFKKSQLKIPHFFSAPQKLFLLITLKKGAMYEVKPLIKVINKNNFCGAAKKCEIFSCDFSKIIRIVHVRLFGTLKYLIKRRGNFPVIYSGQ